MMSETNQAITNAIRELRQRLKLSQQAFATTLDTSVRTVAHWDAGRVPSFKSLVALVALAEINHHPDLAIILGAQVLPTIRLAIDLSKVFLDLAISHNALDSEVWKGLSTSQEEQLAKAKTHLKNAMRLLSAIESPVPIVMEEPKE